MSTLHYNPYDKAAHNAAKFAHELANLLDGSMRNVSLVRTLMRDKEEEYIAASEEDLLVRLQTAEQGMKQMAALLRQWLQENHQPAVASSSDQTLGEALSQARALHEPAAKAMDIEINLHSTNEAAQLPAGPVFSMVANALRNSIEAISMNAKRNGKTGVIDIRAQVQSGQVRISVTDNGPGFSRDLFDITGLFRFDATTKPNGHGLGLSTARDIAQRLGGHLRVTNCDHGGAQVTLTYAERENTTPRQQQSRVG